CGRRAHSPAPHRGIRWRQGWPSPGPRRGSRAPLRGRDPPSPDPGRRASRPAPPPLPAPPPRPWPARWPRRRPGSSLLAQQAGLVALPVALGGGLALVVDLLALGERDLQLRRALVVPVELHRDDGAPLAL